MANNIPDAIAANMGLPIGGAVMDKAIAFFSRIHTSDGTPEGAVTAPVGDFDFDITNGVFYAKQTGSGNTGWVASVGATVAIPILNKTADFTVSTAEAGDHYQVNKASTVTVTVPTNTSDPIPVGTPYDGHQHAAGVATIAPEDGTVTILSTGSLLSTRTAGSPFQLLKLATNTWLLTGDLA